MTSNSEKTKPKLRKNQTSHLSRNPAQTLPRNMGQSSSVIKVEVRQLLNRVSLEQRQKTAQQFLEQLESQGVDQSVLQETLSLSTVNPDQMNSEEISQVAAYTYQHYPDFFQSILTEPNLVQCLSHRILSAIVGIMAAKWLNRSTFDNG